MREEEGNKVTFKSIIYMSRFNPFPHSCFTALFSVLLYQVNLACSGKVTTKGKKAFNHSHLPCDAEILFHMEGLMLQLQHSTHADFHFLSRDFQEF